MGKRNHVFTLTLSLFQESIVAQLFTRYTQGVIYTYIGDILLAVNPFSPLNIYSEEYVRRYMNAAKADNPPHIFAIADQAYQMLVHQKKHQVCSWKLVCMYLIIITWSLFYKRMNDSEISILTEVTYSLNQGIVRYHHYVSIWLYE